MWIFNIYKSVNSRITVLDDIKRCNTESSKLIYTDYFYGKLYKPELNSYDQNGVMGNGFIFLPQRAK